MSGPENDLSNTLSRKADEFARRGGADLDLSQVVSRAGEIRRGRRMRASMAMAAVVLAVAVPVGITVIGNDPTRSGNGDPAASSTPTPTPTVTPNRDPITLQGLATGAAPNSAYYADGALHYGSVTVPLAQQPRFFARINGGFLYAVDEGFFTAHFIADDGTVLDESWSVNDRFAVSPDGNVGAFVTFSGKVVAIQDGGSRTVEIGTIDAVSEEDSFSAVAVVGEDCSGASGCVVYATNRGVEPMALRIAPGQASTRVHPSLMSVVGRNQQGLVAGVTSVSDDGSCSLVLSENDSQVGTTCDYSFDAFSPDGRYLLAGPAYRDGLGDGSMAVLDPTIDGSPQDGVVLDLRTTDTATITDTTWEDATHVLALVYQEGSWAVVRFGLDGSRELVLPKVDDGDELMSPYVLGNG